MTQNFLQNGLAVDFAIHAPGPHSDSRNVHLHILATTRWIEPNGFGLKLTPSWYKRERLIERRSSWERINNLYLERQGLDIRIDCRSYKDRGIDRIPTRHIGAKAMGLERRGIETIHGNRRREIESINTRHELDNQVVVINPLGGEISMPQYLKSFIVPPHQAEISMGEVIKNHGLEQEYWVMRQKQHQRDLAISRILNGFEKDKKIMANDLCALSHEDILGLRKNGVLYLNNLLLERNQERTRDVGRER